MWIDENEPKYCELCEEIKCTCEDITADFKSVLTSDPQDINEVLRKVEGRRNILNAEFIS